MYFYGSGFQTSLCHKTLSLACETLNLDSVSKNKVSQPSGVIIPWQGMVSPVREKTEIFERSWEGLISQMEREDLTFFKTASQLRAKLY